MSHVPEAKYKESFLPKFNYFKKPSISEDYEKVSYVPKVPSEPKKEYNVSSLSKKKKSTIRSH